MTIAVTVVAVVVPDLTAPTEMEKLNRFVAAARPFKLFWRPVLRKMNVEYR